MAGYVVWIAMKLISPLMATVIILSIAIVLSIALAIWISGIYSTYTTEYSVKLEMIHNVYALRTFFVDIENKGSTATSITHVFINDREARLVWAWDLTTNTYLGRENPLLEPGHTVRIAIRSPQAFDEGIFVNLKIYTSMGYQLGKLLYITGHSAQAYINDWALHMWNYDSEHMLAIYRDYYVLYDNGVIPDVPRLFITGDWRSIRGYNISFNMWYALMNLYQNETILTEIALTDGSSSWGFIDLIGYRNRSLYLYTSFDGYSALVSGDFTEAHRYTLCLRVYSSGSVEIDLFIDGEKVYSRNTTIIYGWFIANYAIGIWDPAAMYDLYFDKYSENIDYIYYDDYSVYDEFNTTTTVFTSYVTNPPNIEEITSYPVILYDGNVGFELEEV